MNFDFLWAFFIPFILTLALIPAARIIALKAGFTDNPGGRKQHAGPVPPIGGLVIFPVFMTWGAVAGFSWELYWPLYAGLAVLLIAGALDDAFHVNAWVKFGAQLIAAALVVLFGQAHVHTLGDLLGLGAVELGWLSAPLSILAVALLINAVNLIDGLDGLAGGICFVMILWLALAGFFHSPGRIEPLVMLLAVLAGFLVYNLRYPGRRRASIFLGDSGSMALGLMVAWFAIDLAQGPDPALKPISVAWILAFPVMDTFAQFYRRIRQGRHPFDPDRGHFHHHLVHAGWTAGRASAFIIILVFALGAIGFAGLPPAMLTVVWVIVFFAHIAVSYRPERYVGLFSRFPGGDVDKA